MTFAIEQKCVTAAAGGEAYGVVCDLSLEVFGSIRTRYRDNGALAPEHGAFLADLPVLGIDVRGQVGGHTAILRPGRSR
jgi:hypothetical protein